MAYESQKWDKLFWQGRLIPWLPEQRSRIIAYTRFNSGDPAVKKVLDGYREFLKRHIELQKNLLNDLIVERELKEAELSLGQVADWLGKQTHDLKINEVEESIKHAESVSLDVDEEPKMEEGKAEEEEKPIEEKVVEKKRRGRPRKSLPHN